MIPIKERLESDVLIVGGGIAGLMAAIAAADKGASVTLLDKANTKRSGAGATGNDHFLCYIPEKHGTINVVYEEFMDSQNATSNDTPLVMRFLETSPTIVNMWNDWGINMKPTGDFHFEGHAYPGRPKIFLKYDGHNQKKVLTEQAKKRGVRIVNHSPVLELLRDDNGITGALALDISSDEPAYRIVKAKAVVVATGYVSRLFTTDPTPSQMFNTNMCPSGTGDSIAQAWRLGAHLVNMEKTYRHAGPRFLARCGKATWIGVYRYPNGKPIGPFITKPNVETGDMTSDIWASAFTDLKLNGTGHPIWTVQARARKTLNTCAGPCGAKGSPRCSTIWTRKASIPADMPWNSGSTKPTSVPTASKSTSTAKAISAACSRRAT